MSETCRVCGRPVEVMVMKNTGLCSGRCEKAEAES